MGARNVCNMYEFSITMISTIELTAVPLIEGSREVVVEVGFLLIRDSGLVVRL